VENKAIIDYNGIMKHIEQIRFKITLLVILLTLSGCVFIRPIPKDLTHSQTWTGTDDYYAIDTEFHLAHSQYIEEDATVFWVESEMELALLLTVRFDQGEFLTEYLSEERLDHDKVVSYLISLFVHDFEYYEGTIEYSENGRLQAVTDTVTLVVDEDEIDLVEKKIDEWTYVLKKQNLEDVKDVMYLHDQIIKRVRYDDEAIKNKKRDSDAFSARGVFEDGLAVCNGYSQAYMGLLKEMGIPSLMVSSDAEDHAWNLVYIDHEWKYVDATWDDYDYPIEKPMYDYFLLDQAEFYDHEFDDTGYMTLSEEEYLSFAEYVFPQTAN